MSIETWKAEFYPMPAHICPPEDAIEHSLTKWRGLRPDALHRHGLRADGALVTSDGEEDMLMSSSSCALCSIHLETVGHCRTCPLYAVLGRPCDHPIGELNPWSAFTNAGDPEPMIAALEKAQADAEAA